MIALRALGIFAVPDERFSPLTLDISESPVTPVLALAASACRLQAEPATLRLVEAANSLSTPHFVQRFVPRTTTSAIRGLPVADLGQLAGGAHQPVAVPRHLPDQVAVLVVHGGCGRAGLVADFAESFGLPSELCLHRVF
jgi:hypothetical protein